MVYTHCWWFSMWHVFCGASKEFIPHFIWWKEVGFLTVLGSNFWITGEEDTSLFQGNWAEVVEITKGLLFAAIWIFLLKETGTL
jgi:hypothetical protein